MKPQPITGREHWKEVLNYEHLGAYSLEDGKDRVLTVKSATKEAIKNEDGKEDTCLVLYFAEDEKGMIINATNAKRIEAIYKTGIVSEWIGKRIQIYIEQVKAWGKVVPALRVREFEPASPKQSNLKEFGDKVRKALDAYQGDDKEMIRAMLAEKQAAKELTIEFLSNTLKTLTDATRTELV
ncbi:MAG: hypothetical protein IPJ00_17385 [Saprospirales bacterium]|nr:hypothetical protein [Saprospirales bacterium]